MDYHNRIGQIAALAGIRNDKIAPLFEQPIISIDLSKTNTKAHYVLSHHQAKAVLKNPDLFIQDHFLDELLTTCDPGQVRSIGFSSS